MFVKFSTTILKSIVRFSGYMLAKMPHFIFLYKIYSLAFIMGILDRRRCRDAEVNLDFVYDDKMDESEKRAIIKRCYQNFSFAILQSIRIKYIKYDKLLKMVEIENEHYFRDAIKDGGNAIIFSAHYGYWEGVSSIMPKRYPELKITGLGRLTKYDWINDMMYEVRESSGAIMIDKKGALRKLMGILSKKNQVVGAVVDQNMDRNEGVWVDFFGKDATHTPVASILSRRFSIPIIPVFVDMNRNYSKFTIRFLEPFFTEKSDDMELDILKATQKQAKITEDMILKNPDMWFWFHKRWKAKYREMYER